MPYVAPIDLIDHPGPLELAQCATPTSSPLVDAALMRATLAGTSRSDWPADQVAVADQALATIIAACATASSTIDSYLALRYPLPLAGEHPALKVWATNIARYRLHPNLRVATAGSELGQHPIHRDYEVTIGLLEKIAAGKLSLGANDPSPPAAEGSGATYISGEPRNWSRESRRRAL